MVMVSPDVRNFKSYGSAGYPSVEFSKCDPIADVERLELTIEGEDPIVAFSGVASAGDRIEPKIDNERRMCIHSIL